MDNKVNKKRVFSAIRAIVFTLIFVFILLLLNPVFIPKENTKEAGIKYYTEKIFYAEPENTIDVMFLGNSNLYRCIVPLQLYKDHGYAAFDTARASARTIDLYYMLKDILTRQKIKLLVLETDAAFRDAPDPRKMSSFTKSSITYLTDGINAVDEDLYNELGMAFPSIKYHSRWKTLTAKDFTTEPDYTTVKDSNKGYMLSVDVKPYTGKNYMEPSDKVDVIQPANSIYMDMIVDLCKKNNIQLLLYESPSAKSWNYQRHNGVVEFAKKHDLKFLDFNVISDDINIDWNKDTKDKGEHMNIFGAQKCTEYMGKYLANNYSLPDRRGDAAYATWDKDLQKFEKSVSSEIQKKTNAKHNLNNSKDSSKEKLKKDAPDKDNEMDHDMKLKDEN